MSSLRRSRLSSPPRKTIKLEESIDDAEITIKHEEIDISETILKEEQDVDLPDLHPNVHSPMENDLNHKDTEIEDLDTPDLIETVEISELNHILEKNTIVVDRAYSQATSSNASPGNDLKNQDDSNMKSDELSRTPKYRSSITEAMESAIFAVKNNHMSCAAASAYFGVSRPALEYNVNRNTLPKKWFKEIGEYIKKHYAEEIMRDPTRIFCADASVFPICRVSGIVLAPTRVVEFEGECLSVLVSVAADGTKAPPSIIYPHSDTIEIARSVPDNWGHGVTEDGKLSKDTFNDYLQYVFYEWLKKSEITLPVILFVNGLQSYVTDPLYVLCSDRGIILVPPNSFLRPCQVTILEPLKLDWQQEVKRFCTGYSHSQVTRNNFAALFQHVYERFELETIKRGFQKCGLYPFNGNVEYYYPQCKRSSDWVLKWGPECDKKEAVRKAIIAVKKCNLTCTTASKRYGVPLTTHMSQLKNRTDGEETLLALQAKNHAVQNGINRSNDNANVPTIVRANVQANDNANVQANVNTNVQTNVHANVNTNVQENDHANVQANVNTNVNTNVQANVQTSVNAKVQTNVNTNVQTNVNANVQTNVNANWRRSVSKARIREWFTKTEKYFTDQDFQKIFAHPSRIFCVGETSFAVCRNTGNVLAPMGENYLYMDEKYVEFLTVIVNVAADGTKTPPCITYSYKDLAPADFVRSFSDERGFCWSRRGKITKESFSEYMWNVFYKWLIRSNIMLPIILFINGIPSYITDSLEEYCLRNGIILVTPPRLSSHILHPCHKSILEPLKVYWTNVIKTFCSENRRPQVNKVKFARLFQQFYESVAAQTIKNGFSVCGLFPFNVDAVQYHQQSTVVEKNENEDNNARKIQQHCASKNGDSDNNMKVRISDDKVILTPARPADIRKIALRHMEKFIPSEMLQDFIDCAESRSEWTGSLAASNLYNVWIQMRSDS